MPVGSNPLGQPKDGKLKIKYSPSIRGSIIPKSVNSSNQPFDDTYQIGWCCAEEVCADVKIDYPSIAETLYVVTVLINTSGDADRNYRGGITVRGLVVIKANNDCREFSSVLALGGLSSV